MPGKALDIGAGANGSVWVSDNKGIWSWTGKNWKKMPGTATRIDVGPQGHAWTIGKGNVPWRWNGKGWDRLPGKGLDIGVGADGTAWMVGTGGGLYRWNGASWTKMPGKNAAKVDVDPQGRAWVIEVNKTIWRWNPVKNGWDKIPTKGIDIGIGADGTVIAIGTDNRSWVWDGSKWTPLPGANDKNITVDRNGYPWVISKANNIWAWDTAGKAKAARITSKPWKPEGGKWGEPLASKEGGIVTVTGSVKGGDYITPVMILPTGMRPSKRLVFNLNNHAKPVRMDVLPDGRVLWIAGGRDRGWLSLSGITFPTKKGKAIALKNGWKPEGGPWAPPTAFKSGDIVTVSGSIKGGKYGLLGTLPAGMRPPATLVFNVNNHAKSVRVDVLPNGDIHWKAGGKDHGWISLAGITFSTKWGTDLPLVNAWKPEGGEWAPPTITRQGDMVTLTGSIKGGRWGHLATLPTGFRPPARMVFSANNHDKSARVDVKENGEILWVAGAKDRGWISLSGISFQTDEPPPRWQHAAMIKWGKGKAYIFSGNQYTLYDIKADRAFKGYPRPINSKSWPGLTFKTVDAAVNWGNGTAYFFSGNQYIRYDIKKDRAFKGYPKPINWPGLTFKTIDAAVNWGNGKVYLFSGNQFARYDIKKDRMDGGFPRPISSKTWGGLPFKTIGAAVNWGNDKAFIISGNQYILYDIKKDRMAGGFPKLINSKTWPGLEWE